MKRAYGPKNWTTPGGRLEAGETPTEALIREVQDETGYLVYPERLIGIYSKPYKDDLVLSIEAVIVDRCVWEPNCEITEHGFFGRNELPKPMYQNTLVRILHAIDGKTSVLCEFQDEIKP